MSDDKGDEVPLGSGRMRDGFDVPARVVNAVRSVRCVCGNPRLCLVTVREKGMGRTMSLGRNEAWWFTFRCLTPRCGAEHTFIYDDHIHPSHEGWQPVKAVVRADLDAVSLDADGAVKPIADLAYPAVEVAGCVVPPEFTDDLVTAPVLAEWGHGASWTHLPLNPDGPGVSPPVVVDNEKAQRFQEGQFMSDLVRRATAFHGRCSVRSDEVGRECGVVKELVEALAVAVNAHEAAAEELNQYASVVQRGVRIPAPQLNQDPAFAAFLIGNLERERDAAVARFEKLNAAGLGAEDKFIGPYPARRRAEGPFASPGPGGTEAPKPDRMKFLSVRLIHLVCGFAQHLRPADLEPKCLEMRDGGQTEAVFRFAVNGRTQVFAVAWGQDGREKSPAFHTLLACKLAAGAAADFPGATGVARKESGEFVVLQ